MSDWSEIDRQISNVESNEPICFFEDNFELPSKVKTIEPLPDTNEYIRCLEKKLDKVKGKSNTKNKSKDIIESLANVRQDTIRNFLNEQQTVEFNTDDCNGGGLLNSGNYLDKKIHPERQALTAEEQQQLLKADVLAKRTESNEQIKN